MTEPNRDRTIDYVEFGATDLEGARARVTAQHGKIVRDIFSFPGGRRFQFLDLNGNELAVWGQ